MRVGARTHSQVGPRSSRYDAPIRRYSFTPLAVIGQADHDAEQRNAKEHPPAGSARPTVILAIAGSAKDEVRRIVRTAADGASAEVLPVLYDEDKAAAREDWARLHSERERVRQAAAREQLHVLRRRREGMRLWRGATVTEPSAATYRQRKG